jgi:hypothetical protein
MSHQRLSTAHSILNPLRKAAINQPKGNFMSQLEIQFALSLMIATFLSPSLMGQESAKAQTLGQPKVGINELVQYGKMHEVIGMQEHEARVVLAELIEQPHFYAVGALAGLQGEISVIDSRATVTEVTDQAQAKSVNNDAAKRRATLLIGAYVDEWIEIDCEKDLTDRELDDWIRSEIQQNGGDVQQPIMFMLRGTFADVHLHVINGACPVHARVRQIEIPESKRPFDTTIPSVSGEVVGVFALDAAGKLTHPATSTHKHLVYAADANADALNGHVESLSVKLGTRLFLPIQR